MRRSAPNLNLRIGRDEIEELDDVPVVHAHTTDRAGLSHFRAVGRAVDVDVAPHRIDVAEAVFAGLTARKPQDSRQNPVATRILRVELRRPDLAGGTPPHENGAGRLARAD